MNASLATGTAWMVGMRWVLKLIGLVNTAILARVLTPEDFGVMAMAMVIIELAIVLTDGDFEVAVVRRHNAERDFYDSAWTARLLAGGASAVLLLLCAAPAGLMFDDPRVTVVVAIGALRPLIAGFENIGTVDFRRNLDFAGEFRYLVLQRFLSLLAGLALVFSLADYRALAWSAPASAMVTVVLSYMVSPYRPRLGFARMGDLSSFSRWLVLFNCARMLNERVDQFLIGRLSGAAAAGGYYVAFDIATMPTRELMLPAGRALLPNFARIAHDPVRLSEGFAAVMGCAAILCCAMGPGIALVAEDLLRVFLGERWVHMAPVFQLLALFATLEGIWLMLDPLMIATGRERTLATANLMFTALLVPAVAVTAYVAGTQWIPVARMAIMALMLLGMGWRVVSWGWIGIGPLLGALWRPVAAALIMAAAVIATRLDVAPILSLVWSVGVGAVTFPLVLAGLWLMAGRPDGAERMLLTRATAQIAAAR
ncbi:MAG: oligosaccharide flippase family protein [Rhodospirillaceae bacterium]|nr:oligosaccharide flippase family protein [Rhodospirillales bacterium]